LENDVEAPARKRVLAVMPRFWWQSLRVEDVLERAASMPTHEINASLSEMKAEIAASQEIAGNTSMPEDERRVAAANVAKTSRKRDHLKAMIAREHQEGRAQNDAIRQRRRVLLDEAQAQAESGDSGRALYTMIGLLREAWRLDE
jgi:hypothetical protein